MIVFVCTNHMVIRISRKLLEIVRKGNFAGKYVVEETPVFFISVNFMICLSEVFARTKSFFLVFDLLLLAKGHFINYDPGIYQIVINSGIWAV